MAYNKAVPHVSQLVQVGLNECDQRVRTPALPALNIDAFSKFVLSNDWTPGVVKLNPKEPRAVVRRIQDNFEFLNVIGLDVDNTDQDRCSLDEAKKLFSDYKHIIVTTRSHQLPKNGNPPEDRYRVILYLSDAFVGKEGIMQFRAFYTDLCKKYPFIDPACKDVLRWFRPGRELASVSYTGLTVDSSAYVNVDVSKNVALFTGGVEPAQVNRSLWEEMSDEASVAEARRAAKYLMEKAKPAVEGERGDDRLYLTALSLARDFVLPLEHGVLLLKKFYNPRCDPPWPEDSHIFEHKYSDALRYAEADRIRKKTVKGLE
jgi:hypothetical protein